MANPQFSTYKPSEEEFRNVIGYERFYSISPLGHLYRIRTSNGQPCHTLLKGCVTKHGYVQVQLCQYGQARIFFLHSLVLATFVGKRPKGYVCNHKDADKTNNQLSNLEYVTPAENVRHAHALGLCPTGDRHYSRMHPEKLARGDRNGSRQHPDSYPKKLTDEQVREIRVQSESARSLAARFHVTERHIHMIRKGQTRQSVR